ncbi:MAG: multiple sugar transport system ATP-binding protein [Blastococcus sp.]|jgi:multiple sugar transport system ATP-binding protein|nr:multiple sugar transport system ATP-binding protein [Blastococcus sp.]
MTESTPAPRPGATGLDGVTVATPEGIELLHAVTLLAGPAELLAILGPSGSGKSTVLRAIAGLVPIQSGDVLIAGRSVRGVPTHERHLAMVSEAAALIPFLDVGHNVTWGMQARHLPAPEIEDRLRTRSALLRLGRLLGRRPEGLSAGERERVALGRALVDVPSAFLLDEPLGHLDAPERMRMRRVVADVVRSAGVPALFVTHDQTDALALADRVAVVRDGRVVQLDTPRELYRRPVDLFVAGFVGTPAIGLLRGRLVASGDWAGFRIGTRILPLWRPVPPELQGWVGRELVLGLRPTDVQDAGAGGQAEAVRLPATAAVVERMGSQTLVALTVDAPSVAAPGADLPVGPRARLHARFPARTAVRVGDRVELAVDSTQVHVFDPVSGRALWHPPDP